METRYDILGNKYSLIGSRWFTHSGVLIPRSNSETLWKNVKSKNRVPIGADGSDRPGGTVDSVNGMTGDVVLTKTNIGLEYVDNTSDINKPISIATLLALNNKLDKDSIIDCGTW